MLIHGFYHDLSTIDTSYPQMNATYPHFVEIEQPYMRGMKKAGSILMLPAFLIWS